MSCFLTHTKDVHHGTLRLQTGKEGVRYKSVMRAFVMENNAALPLSRKEHPHPTPPPPVSVVWIH